MLEMQTPPGAPDECLFDVDLLWALWPHARVDCTWYSKHPLTIYFALPAWHMRLSIMEIKTEMVKHLQDIKSDLSWNNVLPMQNYANIICPTKNRVRKDNWEEPCPKGTVLRRRSTAGIVRFF